MRFTTGIAVEELNGSAGGTTAARNKSRQYFKIRTTPRNPRTGDQSEVRGRLSAISKAWGGLTDAERLQWDDFAKTQAGRRVLGKAGVLSGFNAFCRIRLNAALVNATITNTPPTSLVIGELVDITVTNVTATGVSINAMMLGGPGNVEGTSSYAFEGQIVVEMTPVLPSGRAGDTTALRFIAVGEDGSSSMQPGEIHALRPAAVSEAYLAKFGASLTAGDKVQVRVKAVSKAEGQNGLSTLKFTKVVTIPAATAGE